MSKKIATISHIFNENTIEQRVSDGFINGTAMCVAHDKDLTQWFRTKDTLELFFALATELQLDFNSVDIQNLDISRLSGSKYTILFTGLLIVRRGSPETGGGTWLHPDLAIQLAQWCNKSFAIQVSRWVREWMMTGQNPIHSQSDIDRLIYRAELKDNSRLRATGQVKAHLEKEDLYDDKEYTRKIFIEFHDQINIVITGEPAWKMRQRLSKILGRQIKDNELIRDYFPPMALQQYIAINDAAANLMSKRGLHPIAAVQEAADLVLPMGFIPEPIDFTDNICLLRERVFLPELPSNKNL